MDTRIASAILVAALHVGCTVFNGANPCDPETGEIGGWVFYHDGQYIDIESRPYALPGDRPFDACPVVRGNISLKGEITDFSDFDHIESIPGFFDNGSVLETSPLERSSCGVIRGFPSLKRITWKVADHGSNVEDPTTCYYLDRFGSLQFVGRDFVCRGSDNLGTELIEVGGTLTCPEERLHKLERVGSIRYRGGTLPNLRWAGQMSTWATTASPNPLEKVDLPALEEVGPYFLPEHPTTNEAHLSLAGGTIRLLNMPMLHHVYGPMGIQGTGLFHDIFVEGRAEQIREQFKDVQVEGRRLICDNDPTDPCPGDPACEEHYGVESLECCGLPWPTCLEAYGESE